MFNRRTFLKSALAASAGSTVTPITALASRQQTEAGYFNVHPFIENNPDAVFIMRTDVDVKTNSEAKKNAGLDFSRSVFVPSDSGVPLTHLIPIKPNLTSFSSSSATTEYEMGILTDVHFTEGVIEGMKELGLGGDQFYMREVNYGSHVRNHGWEDMAERTGANIKELSATVTSLSEDDVVWVDTPDGIWYRKIPYLWPINSADTFMLNIAKFKSHGMGITLCTKNLQGSIAHYYQAHCSGYNLSMNMDSEHRNPNALADIKANYDRHLAAGVPRWDKAGTSWNSGIGMESWASRAIDNNNATPIGLHIVEGIIGRDGNFKQGPHLADGSVDLNTKGNQAEDFMSNIIIFGKNQYNIDIIGHWLAGHEPGNMGLFHMALDFGLNSYLNPFDIPVYDWSSDGKATLTPLDNFDKTPLLTYYLQKDGETYWHMMDEPYSYEPVSVESNKDAKPEAMVLGQNHPNPFNPYTSIEFRIPSAGNTRLEVYNMAGQRIDVLADGFHPAGNHMAVWNTNNHSSGTYFYRLTWNGHSETKKMLLMK